MLPATAASLAVLAVLLAWPVPALLARARWPRRFRARGTREDHAAELMHEVLGQAGDRQAVLARFVGSVGPDEARMLRELLAGSPASSPDAAR